MNIHEYQGKDILKKHGVSTPRGYPCFSVDEAVDAAKKLDGKEGCGIKVTRNPADMGRLLKSVL